MLPFEQYRAQAFSRKAGARDYRVQTRSHHLQHPFLIRGIDRLLPAGDYEVVTDDEAIDALSFAAFRRVATMMMVPAKDSRGLAMEMISIGAGDLADAQRIDASASNG